jgi:hypothetical protein
MTTHVHHSRWAAVAVLVCCAQVVTCLAAAITSTWDDGTLEGWTNSGPASVRNEASQLLVEFAEQGAPSSERCLVWRGYDSCFFTTNITFSILADDRTPSDLVVVLRSRYSGLEWRRYLPEPPAGQLTVYTVPVDFSAGWTLGPGTTEMKFHNDKQNVEWIGIEVERGGATEEQDVFVDNFTVEGHVLTDVIDPPDDADEDGIPDAWEDRYSLASDDPDDALLDSDGDGMNNYAEYRAGTNPTNDMSVFQVNAVPQRTGETLSGVTVEWDSIRYRSYALWKSTNLVEGFTLEQAGILTTPPHNTYDAPVADGESACFYFIEVEED